MLRPACKISINGLEFDFLNALEISSAWKSITDTATLQLPRRLRKGGETLAVGENSLFSRGDRVTIELGYFPELERVFTGFVSAIKPGSPLVLEIEDDAYLFKQNSLTVSYKEVDLKTLLNDISPIPFEAPDVTLGSFRISNANFAQVLAELKKTYGLVSWVRESVLYCGLAYYPDLRTVHELVFQRNIIEHSLEYRKADDVAIKVKAISIQPDNSKIEVEVGDPQGAQRTLTFYDLDQATLKATAERELPKLKYEGYRGDFLTFGAPRIKHGDAITLKDYKFAEREGTYLVDEVITTQGAGEGFRQRVKLGAKI